MLFVEPSGLDSGLLWDWCGTSGVFCGTNAGHGWPYLHAPDMRHYCRPEIQNEKKPQLERYLAGAFRWSRRGLNPHTTTQQVTGAIQETRTGKFPNPSLIAPGKATMTTPQTTTNPARRSTGTPRLRHLIHHIEPHGAIHTLCGQRLYKNKGATTGAS